MPKLLLGEIENNFEAFDAQWPTDLTNAITGLAPTKKYFAASFVRISTIQAWRTSVLTEIMDDDSLAFFFEAQNDLLVSHCLARCGSFRQALKALRSAIENVYFSLYYKDHLVELAKWNLGCHKLGFTDLHKYFEGHPSILGKNAKLTGLDVLKSEYATLSKAVHGSAKSFRMTKDLIDIRLWANDAPSVGKWAAREKSVITALNKLLLYTFAKELLGTKNRALRETVGLIMPESTRTSLKTELNINLV